MMLFITERISNVLLFSFGIPCLAIVYLLLKSPAFRARRAGAGVRLPPGPKQHFLFGNLFNFPRGRWYEAFNQWQKLYGERLFGSLAPPSPLTTLALSYAGDIVYVNLAGVPVIIINSLGAAQELAGKRNRIYSARTAKTMTANL
jgi:hypothetical protein